MRSGFRLRQIANRQTLPEWVLPLHAGVQAYLTPSQYGPEINVEFPLGRYQEDHEWVQGHGDLDLYNGRFAVTPEFPQGTYAYFATIEADGTPAFTYIIGAQYYGTVTGGQGHNIPADASTAFDVSSGPASGAPQVALLTAWQTKNAARPATVVSSFDPSAGPAGTWPPADRPAGARVSGGVTAPMNADVQRVRYNDSNVYMSSNNLASYSMGPWFDALQPGGVFGNWPSAQSFAVRLPRSPAAAQARSASGLGPVGVWVNGVAVFNVLDGGSYSNSRRTDVGGGLVSPNAIHVSAASFERGPMAPGSIVAAFSAFGAVLASGTESASTANWPGSLAGTSVSIRDAAGVTHSASLSHASPAMQSQKLRFTCGMGMYRGLIVARPPAAGLLR